MNGSNGTKVVVRNRKAAWSPGLLGIRRLPRLDVILVRVVVAVVSVITGGAGVLAYLAAWVIIPDEGEKISVAENIVGKSQSARSGWRA